MVAVVTGNGLGLYTSSRNTHGAGGTSGDPQMGRGNESVFVNTTSGNLIIQSQDENLAALGLDLNLVRTYNSQGTADDDNNDGWRHGAQQRLITLNGTINAANSNITKVFGDGSRVVYYYSTSLSAYVSSEGDGAHDRLTHSGGTWTWTDASSRVVETYNWASGVGRIQTSRDANSNTVNYFYNGAGLLNRVQLAGRTSTSQVDQDIYFDYYTAAGSTNDLEKVRVVSGGVTQTLTRYTYDASHRLVTVKTDMSPEDNSVSDNNVYVTTYTYDGSSYRVASITQTRDTSPNVISKVTFTYLLVDGTYRVRTVMDGEGRINTFNYTTVTNPGGNSSPPPAPGWNVPEKLTPPGEGASSVPRIAFDATGNGFALWHGGPGVTSAGASDLYVRRYNRATNTWGPQQIIDTLGPSSEFSISSLAVDDGGNALVSWVQMDASGNYTVYASRFTERTGTWSPQESVQSLASTPSTHASWYATGDLSTSIAQANSAAISWVQNDGVSWSVYVARWNGTAWSASQIDAGTNNAQRPKVAIDDAGNTTVIWIQSDGSYDSIYANRYSVTTGTWDGPRYVETDPGTVTRPQLAYDWAGNAIAVWVQNGNIVSSRYDKAGNSWSPVFTVDTAPDEAFSPSLAVDRQTGAGFVAWVQNDGGVLSLLTRTFTGMGAAWQSVVAVDGTSESVAYYIQQDTAGITTSMSGTKGAVMWNQTQTLDGVNHFSDIAIARLNDGVWAPAEILQYNASSYGGFYSAVAIDPWGNVSALWDTYLDRGIWVARYTAPSQWAGEMPLSSETADSWLTKSKADTNGNVFAVYSTNAGQKMAVRRYDKLTNTWAAEVLLDASAPAGGTGAVQISVDEFGNAIVVWQKNFGSGLGLYCSRYSVQTNTWTSYETIQAAAVVDNAQPGGFSVQMSGGNAVIAWLQKNGASYDLWAARYLNGVFVPPVSLESGAGTVKSVSATIDNAGNIGVAWQQYDDTPGVLIDRIYVNRFTAGGSWSGAIARSGTTVAASDPKIGYDSVGNGLIIWAQGNDIYAQRYDAATGWVGSPAAIDNVNGLTESTSLTVDRLGNAIAAWIQTDTVKSVYAARYTLGSGWGAAASVDASATIGVRTNPNTPAIVISTAIDGNHAAISWLQKTAAGDPNNAVSTEAWIARSSGGAFAPAEMVSGALGVHAFDPSVTIDSQGNAAVVWSRWSSSSQVFVTRFNAITPWSGQNLLAPVETSAAPSAARIAYDAAGNGFAVWSGLANGIRTLWASRFDKAKGTWDPPVAIDTVAAPGTNTRASISVDDGGNAVVAWVRDNGSAIDIYASRYSARDGRWSASAVLDATSLPTAGGVSGNLDSTFSTSIANESNAAVIWLQSNGSATDVYVSRWNGISWTTTPSTIDNIAADATDVSIGIDLDGNMIATWRQSAGSPAAASVMWNRYTATSATSGSWGSAAQLDAVGTVVSRPRLGFDGYGNAIAAWIQGNDVYFRRYDRAAGNWISASLINTGTNVPKDLVLSVDSLGNAVAAWVRHDGTAESAYASYYTAGGSWSSSSTPIESSNLTVPTNSAYVANPAVAIRGNRAVVSWMQQGTWGTNQNQADIYQVRWTGSGWTAREQVDNTAERNMGFFPSVAIDYQGNTTTAFPHWRGSDFLNYFNRYTADSSYTQTNVSDGLGNVTTYKHDSAGRLMSVATPAVGGARTETRYQYDADGNINAVIENATGATPRTTTMIYDTRGNLILTRHADGSTTRRTYDSNNQLTIETSYLLTDATGGPPQAPLTTRYYYDTNSNLRFVVSPEGRVTEHRYFASGTASVGERQNTFVYTATLYTNAAYSLSDLTTWAGQAANIANVDRTDYAYDVRGLLATSTTWATTSAGAGTGTASVTRYTHDQRGLLLTKTTARGEGTGAADYITSFVYDAMRRVTLMTEWVDGSTTRNTKIVNYDDANNRIITTLAGGLVTTQLFDKSGRLISEVKSAGGTNYGTTTFKYNAAGQLATTTLPIGDGNGTSVSPDPVRLYNVYDDLGRKVGAVDGDGTLTQFIYNRLNQVIKTVRYSSRLPSTMLTALSTVDTNYISPTIKVLVDSLAGVAGRDAAKDQVSRSVYDSAGKLVFTLDAVSTHDATKDRYAVTRFYYNGSSRLTDTVSYANYVALTAATDEFTPLQIFSELTQDANADRRTRNFYDKDGNLQGTLDAQGYVTEYLYDGASRLTKKIQYANVSPASNLVTTDFAGARPTADTSPSDGDTEYDIVCRYYYDTQGRKLGELDGEGYLTETNYNVEGNITQTSRSEFRHTSVLDSTTLQTLKTNASGSWTHATKFEYDGVGRVTKQIESAGIAWSDPLAISDAFTLPEMSFDSAGNGIGVWVGGSAGALHVYARRYDKASDAWGAVRQLDVGAGSSGYTVGPSIAMDDAGNAVIAWGALDSGGTPYYSAYAARYTAGTNTWSDGVSIESATGHVENTSYISLATSVAGANAMAVSWVQQNASGWSTYASRWNGTSWTTSLLETSNLDSSSVSVAIDSTGQTTVVWLEAAATSSSQIRYNRYSGGAWGGSLSLDGTTGVTRSRAQIGFDSSGNGVAIWVQGTDLKSKVFTTAGGWSGTTLTLATGTQVARPSLAVSSNGNALVAWTQNDGTASSVYAKRFTSGNWDASASLLENSNQTAYNNWSPDRAGVRATVRGSQAAVIWSQSLEAGKIDSGGNTETFVAKWHGTGWTKPQAINTINDATAGFFGDGSIDGLGNVVASWTSMTGLQRYIVRPIEGVVTNTQYNDVTRITKTVHAQGTADERITYVYHDALGRKEAELGPEGAAQITVGMSSPAIDDIWNRYATRYAYDNAGRMVKSTVRVSDTAALTTTNYYDADGRLRFTVDPRNHVTERKYNALGELTEEIDHYRVISAPGVGGLLNDSLIATLTSTASAAVDGATTYTYSKRGQVETAATAGGTFTRNTYNHFGQLYTQARWLGVGSQSDPANSVERKFHYDRRGLVTVDYHDETGIFVAVNRTYDAFGRLVSTTDPRSSSIYVTRNEYDALGRQVAVTDALGARSTSTYDAFSRQLVLTDALGKQTKYTYNDATRRVIVTTPEGVSIATESNRYGETLRVTAGNNTTDYQYDLNGRLIKVSDNLSDSLTPLETRTYDRAGRQLTGTDAHGALTTFAYDASSRTISRLVTNALDSTSLLTSINYDTTSRVMTVTEPGNRVTRTEYDLDGRVSKVAVDPSGLNLATAYTYDGLNNTLNVIESAAGVTTRRTQYVYDKLGRRTDDYLDAASLGGTLNLRTQYKYDKAGNLTRKIDARNNSTWYLYSNSGQRLYEIDAMGGVTSFRYDAAGRVTQTRQYSTAVSTAGFGNEVSSVTVPTDVKDRVQTTVYDGDGRAIFSIDGVGAVTERTFDRLGNVTRSIRYAKAVAVAEYADRAAINSALNAAGNSAGTPGANDQVTWNTYDARGRLEFSVDATDETNARVIGFTYDNAGNIRSKTAYYTALARADFATVRTWAAAQDGNASNQVTRFWYDGVGRQRFVLDAEGYLQEVSYTDVNNATTQIAYASKPLVTLNQNSTYTEVNNAALALASASNHVTTTWRDAANRTRYVRDAEGYVVATDYLDTTRQERTVVYASVHSISSSTTLTQVTSALILDAAKDQHTTRTYDAVGRLTQVTDALGFSEYYGYDAVGNKTKFVNKKGSGPNDTTYMWTYDYDANGRLTYEYLPNVAVTTVLENGLNFEVSTNDSLSLVNHNLYDTLGNLTSRIEAENTSQARTTSYEYDLLGRQTATVSASVGVYSSSGDNLWGYGAAAVPRTEIQSTIRSETSYDVFGNAFRSRRFATAESGDASKVFIAYKVYDNLGREIYDIDAKRQVTSTTYDAFGNKLAVTRHAAALASPITFNSNGISKASVVTAGLTADPAADRVLYSVYDRLNRRTTVQQSIVWHFIPNTNSQGGTTVQAAATTESVYDAFGNVVWNRELTAPGIWANSYFTFDRRNQLVADIDALQYLTKYEHDAAGNLTRKLEFALPTIGVPGSATFWTPVTSAGGAAAGADRDTRFGYDKLNRKTSEKQVDIEYSSIDGSGVLSTAYTGIHTTSFGYDAVGNQTRITDDNLGTSTYTYFDVLGRVIAVAAPQRDVTGALNAGSPITSLLIPLSRHWYDAFGNLAQQTDYSLGAASIPVDGSLPTVTSASLDRTTTYLVDKLDRITRVKDSMGANSYVSFNSRGDIAKQWQTVSNDMAPGVGDDIIDVLATRFVYDEIGRRTNTIQSLRYDTTAGTTVTVTRVAEYNAFGEVKAAYNSGATEENKQK
jgi:YD repeat-containing protein